MHSETSLPPSRPIGRALLRAARTGMGETVQLHGRKAVVTGAGRGIGRAVASALARAGAELLLGARSAAEVEAVASELRSRGAVAHAVTLDVTREDSVEALAREAASRLGDVDILINNAGVAGSAPIKSLTLEDWNRMFAVNATGAFLCARAFLPRMAARGWGRVVNIASITSRVGTPYIAAYTASKHAVLGLTRVAAAEYADTGVTVNAVCPGYVDTEMTTASVARVKERTGLSDEASLAAILKTANQKRLISPEEVAFVVLSLCDELGGGINGQAIVVDGGGLLA